MKTVNVLVLNIWINYMYVYLEPLKIGVVDIRKWVRDENISATIIQVMTLTIDPKEKYLKAVV